MGERRLAAATTPGQRDEGGERDRRRPVERVHLRNDPVFNVEEADRLGGGIVLGVRAASISELDAVDDIRAVAHVKISSAGP